MLSPVRGPRKLRTFSTYDLEWYPDSYELRLIGCYDGERYSHYTSVESFLEAQLTPENSGRWFWAHYGGTADMLFLILPLADAGYHVDVSLTGSSANIVRVRRGQYEWLFLDSAWLMRVSLRAIGQWIGLEKGGAEGSDEAFFAPLSELIAYNERDCQVLWQAIYQFECVLLGLGSQLQPTIASCALQLFRRQFLSRRLIVPPEVNRDTRNAYVASRVEVVQRTCDAAEYYDVNSSFPHAMTFPQPGSYVRTSNALPNHSRYCARVRIEVPDMHMPPIPWRGERVYYPVGTWETWLMGVDVECLEAMGGRILKLGAVHEFDESHDLEAYATRMYALRKAPGAGQFESVVYKFLGNSLYGKFAEGDVKEGIEVNPLDTMHREPSDMITPGIWRVSETIEIPHECVPLSANITAIARRTLYQYLIRCDPYYCDTDSVVTSQRFDTGEALGELKHEATIERGEFLGPKLYAYQKTGGDWHIRAKGFSRPKDENKAYGTRKLTYDDFCKLREGDGLWLERMMRMREMLRKGESPRSVEIIKRLRDPRDKRCFGQDGRSRPWHVKELEA